MRSKSRYTVRRRSRRIAVYRVWDPGLETDLWRALRTGRGVTWACARAGVSRSTVYRRVHLDREFGKRFEIARLHGDIERARIKIRRLRGTNAGRKQ